ncbi:TPA: hypothetical protein HA242_05305 [Candidatus Woesearchaeota archaeon]|nr:hypothetical protein [Candidatus Woesearchaeota archaeon]HIH13115.1 hypothetical protein [Candidatus Woesearchaeota archaeon]
MLLGKLEDVLGLPSLGILVIDVQSDDSDEEFDLFVKGKIGRMKEVLSQGRKLYKRWKNY